MTLDQLVAERDAVLEQGDHGDECGCDSCVEERRSDQTELQQQWHDAERLMG